MVKRLSLALVFLSAGLVAGIVLTGRMRSDEVAVAQSAARPDAATRSTARTSAVTAAPGPDFTRVAEQTVRAVANISSIQVVRQRTSPFFNDPFFQQFFGDPDGMFGSRNRYASSLGSGVIVSADGYVVTNNHVLGQGSIERRHRRAGRQARARSEDRRRRQLDRPGAAEGRRDQSAGDSVG